MRGRLFDLSQLNTIIKNDDDHHFESNFYFPVDIFENVNGDKATREKFISYKCLILLRPR